jgi:hypothetical protein
MKWLSTSKDSHQEVYELFDSKERILSLAYHPASATLRISGDDKRISGDDKKRVFLVGREGFLRRRTVLRNEYGIRMGQLSEDTNQEKQGTIDIYETNFTYILQNDHTAKVAIYRNSEMLMVCELPAITEKISTDNYDVLILTLCWYVSISIKKQVEEYA